MRHTDHIISLLLFRQETIAWAERLPGLLNKEADECQETTARFRELLREGKRWSFHPYLWCLRGPRKQRRSLELIELASESYTYGGRAQIVERLPKPTPGV